MKDLVAMFQDTGCANVRTYIQSGNVLFDANAALLTRVPKAVNGKIKQGFGYDIPVVIRSAKQLEDAIRKNPFLKRGEDEARLHIMFLASTPRPDLVKQLDPRRSDPDEFVVRGQDIYLYLRNGAAKTKLTNAYFDAKLMTISTGRNWRTVNKLNELAAT
jgi:uncharacterized protein (DUF1697 family)